MRVEPHTTPNTSITTTTLMSFYRSVKQVAFPTAGNAPSSLGDDWDMDSGRAYDVYIDPRPYSAFQGSAHEGDLYVRIIPDAKHHTVHVYTESDGWIEWDPSRPLPVVMVGTAAQTCPCTTQGLRYVAMQEDVHHVLANTPKDIGILAELIAKDVEYPPLVRGRKRVTPEVVTSPPKPKRSRRKLNKPLNIINTVQVEMAPPPPPAVPLTVPLDDEICMNEAEGPDVCMGQLRELSSS